MEKSDIKIGINVLVPHVRSNHLDLQKGIGWYARNVIVEVSKINDLTFCFEFNAETHFELINEVKVFSSNQTELFKQNSKITYAKDSYEYKYSTDV